MQITKGTISAAQKVVVYGPEGIGKSTFASKFPDPLFIDTEGSTKKLDVHRAPKPSSWSMLMEEVREVRNNPSLCETLVIDTADWAEQLCVNELLAKAQKSGIEDFGYGKGYVYLAEDFGRLLNLLEEVIERGVHVVITAHAQMRKFEQPDEMGAYDRWELKLQKKTAPLLMEWADTVLFANYKTYVVNVDGQGSQKGKNKAQGGKRVMFTAHHSCWDAKNRDNLKPELDFEFCEIAHILPDRINNAIPVQVTAQTSSSVTPPATQKKPESENITYWHHPESDCVLMVKTADEANRVADEGGMKITKDEYEMLQAKYEKTEPKPDKEPETSPSTPPPPAINPDIPRALADLMKANGVLEVEIQTAVASKGYYPFNTPIKKYDPNFVSGVLVGAWSQVFQMIQAQRKSGNIPF